MEIKVVGFDRRPLLVEFLRAAFASHPDTFAVTPDEFDRGIGSPRFVESETWVVAEHDDRIIGCAALFQRPTSTLAHKADVRRVYVVPEHRGSQAAELMVRAVIDVRPSHILFVRGSTAANNVAAKHLAVRLGFTVYAVEPSALMIEGNLVDEVWMQLDCRAIVSVASG